MAQPVRSAVGWTATLVVAASAVGVAAAINPFLAAAVLGGLVLAVLPVLHPIGAVCLFTILGFFDESTGLPAHGSFTTVKVAGLLLVFGWLIGQGIGRWRDQPIFRPRSLFALAVCFVMWAALSVVWADHSSAAASETLRYALNIILFVIVFAAVREPVHVIWLIAAFVVGSVCSAGLGLLSSEDPSRLSGGLGGPNETGAVLVVGLVFSIALVAIASKHPWRQALAIGAVAFSAYALALTVSRASLVSLATVVIVSIPVAGRWRWKILGTGLCLTMLIAAYFVFFASPEARNRFTNEGSTGRTDIWRVGTRMVEDNPILGVGAGNFQIDSVNYLLRPGLITRSEFIVDDPKVAHNIYLGVLAELGVLGLALFMAILVSSLVCALKAAKQFAVNGMDQMEMLSRALFVGLAGLLASDFFGSQIYSKQLWLMLALGPAMLAIAKRRPASESSGSLKPSILGLERPTRRVTADVG